MKIENLFLCVLPSAIWVYLHTAWMSPAVTPGEMWEPFGVFELPWEHHNFHSQGVGMGEKALTAITAMTHRPVFGRGNEGWRNKGLKGNFGKRNGRRWGCSRLDPGWVQVSKAASLSLVSKSGKYLSKDAARKTNEDIYLQHQQLPSFSLAQLKDPFSKPSIHLPDWMSLSVVLTRCSTNPRFLSRHVSPPWLWLEFSNVLFPSDINLYMCSENSSRHSSVYISAAKPSRAMWKSVWGAQLQHGETGKWCLFHKRKLSVRPQG